MSQMISPDGAYRFDPATNSWQPNVQQPAPPPPPPAAQQAPPPPYGAPPPGYGAPPPPQMQPTPQPAWGASPAAVAPWAAPAPAAANGAPVGDTLMQAFSGGLDFNDPSIVGAASLPEGDHVVRVDDVEYTNAKTSQADRGVVKCTTMGGASPNRSGVWGYNLTPKTIFRLGKDLQKLNLGLQPNGQKWSPDGRTLCGELTAALRGKLIKIRVSPQIDRETKLPSADGYTNTVVLGWAEEGAPPIAAPPPYAQPPQLQAYANAPQTAAPPPNAPPQVSYPTPAPLPGMLPAQGFQSV